MSVIRSIFGEQNTKMADSVIANDMLAGAKAGAAGYLMASLECSTPEVRMLFGQYSAQVAQGHTALTELAIKRGWYQPYDAPIDQLQTVYDQSQKVVEVGRQ